MSTNDATNRCFDFLTHLCNSTPICFKQSSNSELCPFVTSHDQPEPCLSGNVESDMWTDFIGRGIMSGAIDDNHFYCPDCRAVAHLQSKRPVSSVRLSYNVVCKQCGKMATGNTYHEVANNFLNNPTIAGTEHE